MQRHHNAAMKDGGRKEGQVVRVKEDEEERHQGYRKHEGRGKEWDTVGDRAVQQRRVEMR